jgi:hypothetical protein
MLRLSKNNFPNLFCAPRSEIYTRKSYHRVGGQATCAIKSHQITALLLASQFKSEVEFVGKN